MQQSANVNLAVVAVLTLVSGLLDAQGFVHAARIWDGSRLVGRELAFSAAGFGLGIACYWIAVRFARYLGVVTPEIQTLGWFAATIVGVGLLSGDFFKWRPVDQGLAAALAVLLGLLLYRTTA